MIGRLNTKKAKEAKPGKLCDGGGLWLFTGAKSKSWVVRYMIAGKAVEMGIGSYDDLDLGEARERARLLRQQVRRKDELGGPVDVLAVRRAEHEYRMESATISAKKAITFRGCADGYLKANADSWKNAKHRQQWFSTLSTYVYPFIGDMPPVKRIDVGDVVRVLQPIWHEKPETARRVRMRIERVIGWAISMEYYDRANPATLDRLRDLLGKQTDTVTNQPAMPYEEIGDFMPILRAHEGIGALALEWCILTVTRTGETLGARWEEIDRSKRLWNIPGERRKGRKGNELPLTVPLPDRCMAILDEAAKFGQTGLMFPGRSDEEMSENTMLFMLQRRLGQPDVTVHGFRSTFTDWAEDCTAYPRDLINFAGGHKLSDKVLAAYRRRDALEKRRHLMRDWAKFCATPSVRTGDVVTLHRDLTVA
jgi:integrase